MLNVMQEEVTQQDISSVSMVDVMTVSSVLPLLEKKGYINRKPSKIDSRANSVTVTTSGNSVLKEATQKVEKADKSFFDLKNNYLTNLVTILNMLNESNT